MSEHNKFLEHNKAAFASRYPEMVQSISNDLCPETIKAGIDETCGKKVLYAVMNEKTYQLDTLYDTDALMELWYRNLDRLYFKTKILLYGLGNGMYVRKLLKETTEDISIIVYEPSSCILKTVIHEFDISDLLLNKRVTLLLRDAMEKTPQEYFYDLLEYTDIENFIYKSYLNYNRLFEAEYIEYIDTLQIVCSSINSTQDVIGRYGKIYYENTFSNFPYFFKSKSIQNLYERLPKDVPAIIVAAGPSLDKNVQKLKKAKGRAFIIAVDTALRPMIRNGVIPDLCISIDGKKNAAHFIDAAANDIPLVCYLYSHKAILASHRAEKFFINDLNHHIQHFLSQKGLVLPIIASGGSVANDAFSIVQMLGFTTIILVGQDLALTDNKSHADATVVGELKWTSDRFDDVIEVEGIDGKPVLSKPEYKLYAKWFEEQIIQHPELKVIDATEGGAKIYGTLIQTLDETIGQECDREIDFAAIMKACKDFFDDQTRAELISYIKKIPEDLTECLHEVQEGMKCYEKMLALVFKNKYHTKEFKRLSEQASSIGTELDKCPTMDYIRNRIQEQTSYILKSIYQNEDNEYAELIAICEKGRDYLHIMEDEIKIVLIDSEVKVSRF